MLGRRPKIDGKLADIPRSLQHSPQDWFRHSCSWRQSSANAVEYIINHAEVSIAFVHETKLAAILACLSNCISNLKTIVSFGKISEEQKESFKELHVDCFSWEEFALLFWQGNLDDDLPPKARTDICTIMYTSGTMGEPKGVIINNGAFMAEVLSMDHLLRETDEAIKQAFGGRVTTIEVRLESIPEMGYDACSVVPRGEICLRGTLFSGYYKCEDLTNEVLPTDGSILVILESGSLVDR